MDKLHSHFSNKSNYPLFDQVQNGMKVKSLVTIINIIRWNSAIFETLPSLFLVAFLIPKERYSMVKCTPLFCLVLLLVEINGNNFWLFNSNLIIFNGITDTLHLFGYSTHSCWSIYWVEAWYKYFCFIITSIFCLLMFLKKS